VKTNRHNANTHRREREDDENRNRNKETAFCSERTRRRQLAVKRPQVPPYTPVHPVGGWPESVHDLSVEDKQEDNKNNGEANAEGFLYENCLASGAAP
jgi:hypothetical protein